MKRAASKIPRIRQEELGQFLTVAPRLWLMPAKNRAKPD
jgi:hypothetical protein